MRHPINTLVLIAAPSGAGKTSLALRIIAGELPELAAHLPCPFKNLKRFDIKGKNPFDVIEKERDIILECCISHRYELMKGHEYLLPLLQEAKHLCIITLKLDRRVIARWFFFRILKEAQRRERDIFSLWGLLHFRKYVTALTYRFSSNISKAYESWHLSQDRLQQESHISFTAITLNFSASGGYELIIEPSPSAEQ